MQRTVLAGTELTIRYNSVFEVRKGKILPLGKGTFYNYFEEFCVYTIVISSITYRPRLINIVPVKKVPFEISLKGKIGQTLQKIQTDKVVTIFRKSNSFNSGSLV